MKNNLKIFIEDNLLKKLGNEDLEKILKNKNELFEMIKNQIETNNELKKWEIKKNEIITENRKERIQKEIELSNEIRAAMNDKEKQKKLKIKYPDYKFNFEMYYIE